MPLDLDDPTAIALTIFRALSARRIEAALYGGLPWRGPDLHRRPAVLALDRPRFGGLLISRITLAEGGGRVGLNVVDLKAAWRPSRPLGWGIAVSWAAQPARGIGLP